MWERSLTSLPRGPSTVTVRERMWTFTVEREHHESVPSSLSPKIFPRSCLVELSSNMPHRNVLRGSCSGQTGSSAGDSGVSLQSGMLIHGGSRMCAHLPLLSPVPQIPSHENSKKVACSPLSGMGSRSSEWMYRILTAWVELAEGGELSMSISRGSKFGLDLLVERNCSHGIVRRLGPNRD